MLEFAYTPRGFDSYGFMGIYRRREYRANRRPFARRLSARNGTVIKANCGNEVTSLLG